MIYFSKFGFLFVLFLNFLTVISVGYLVSLGQTFLAFACMFITPVVLYLDSKWYAKSAQRYYEEMIKGNVL